MSSGIDFGAAGVCVLCFDNADSPLYVDDEGCTHDVCCACRERERVEIEFRIAWGWH